MKDSETPHGAPRRTGTPGWRELDEFIEALRSWAQDSDEVLGLAVYGSVARGEADPYSDLDVVLLVRSRDEVQKVEEELVRKWDHDFDFVKDGKRVIFMWSPPIKMELAVLVEEGLPGVRSLFIESRIQDPTRAVLVDKSGKLSSALAAWLTDTHVEDSDPFQREAWSFLYYYHGFHAPFARGDLYRAFFLYSLAFFKLATLAYIARGGTDYLYAPKLLLHRLSAGDAARVRAVSPVFDALRMRAGKEAMFDFFLDLVHQTGRSETFPPERMVALRAGIHQSHPRFYGLRDLGMISGIRPGVVFRAARLDRYPAEELLAWFDTTGLRTLVDLRTDREMAERGYGYPASALERLNYVRLPVTTDLSSQVRDPTTPFDRLARFYAELPNESTFREAVRGVIAILADPGRCPAVIHCRGGTDRTGMLVAVVLLAVRLDRMAVLADYLLSYGHTKADLLQRLFDSIDRMGGIDSFLREVGVTQTELDALRRNLAEPPVGGKSVGGGA